MSGKEIPVHIPQNSEHTFPIPTYTTEQPLLNVPYTEGYLEGIPQDSAQVLQIVLDNNYFRKNMRKLHKKMWKEDFEPYKLEFMQQTITGFSFEIAAHYSAQQDLKHHGFILSSPEETAKFYQKTTLSEGKIPTPEGELVKFSRSTPLLPEDLDQALPIHNASKKPFWTQSDTIIFFPHGEDLTYVLGGGEFTSRMNIGNLSSPWRYFNRDKINQYRYHRSGKVIDDFFVNQPDKVKEDLGDLAHTLYKVPPQLAFEPKWYMSVFAVPEDDPNPVYPKNGLLVRVPVSNETINVFADLLIADLTSTPPVPDVIPQAAD